MNALAKPLSGADLNAIIDEIESFVEKAQAPVEAQRVYGEIQQDRVAIAKAIRIALERQHLRLDDNFRLVLAQ